jgi:hypothetical protein
LNLDGIQVPLWGMSWLMYANYWVGKCPNRCHLEKWSLGPPWYQDVWNVGKGRRHPFATLTNASGGCASKHHYLHGSAEHVCQHSCH